MMKTAWALSSLCVAMIGLAGCSSDQTQPDEYSGFLKNYSSLKADKSPSGQPVMRWINPNLNVHKYTSVYIEPTQFYPPPQPTATIPDSTLQGINSYYNTALKRELGKSLPLANGPGPGVIIVRAAITAVSSKNQGLKPYEVIPIALVAAAVTTASGHRDQETSIATEAAFIDSDTNQVVAEVVRKGAGKTLDNDSQVLKPDDLKAVLDGWATDMHQSYLKLSDK